MENNGIKLLFILFILLVIIFAFIAESKDFKMHSYNSFDKDDDNLSWKLNMLIDCDDKLPKWRRCIIISFISSLLISIAVLRRFLLGEFITILIINYTCFYMSFSFYQYHFYDNINSKKHIILNKLSK